MKNITTLFCFCKYICERAVPKRNFRYVGHRPAVVELAITGLLDIAPDVVETSFAEVPLKNPTNCLVLAQIVLYLHELSDLNPKQLFGIEPLRHSAPYGSKVYD